MAALSPNQRAALETLAQRGQCSAYEARLQMRTLEALERKGLVTAHRQIGSMFSPTTNIGWQITEAGRVAIWKVPSAVAFLFLGWVGSFWA